MHSGRSSKCSLPEIDVVAILPILGQIQNKKGAARYSGRGSVNSGPRAALDEEAGANRSLD